MFDSTFIESRIYFHTLKLHIGLTGRKEAHELRYDLRSEVE